MYCDFPPLKMRIISILFVFYVLLSTAFSAKNTGGSRVLMLVPFGGPSHRICFLPLAKALADRNHEITLVSTLPPIFNHSNIKEIQLDFEIPRDMNTFDIRDKDPTKGYVPVGEIVIQLAKMFFEIQNIKDIYKRRNEFDLMIIDELFSEGIYPFLVGRHYITIATPGVIPHTSSNLGNVLNPSYIPGMVYDYPRPYSLLDRIKNLFFHMGIPLYWRKWRVFPQVESAFREKIPDFPPLEEIENGLVLSLVNTYFALDIPMPLLPSQVEVGGMHCRPAKELPQDLRSFIESSRKGVIYFSLGSISRGTFLPDSYKRILLNVFKKLPYDVIWKYEGDMEKTPKILTGKWMPQQDILAHPNVKLFITHGGLLSMQEAIYHGTPLISMPIIAEQERNSERIRRKLFGEFILWEELTEDKLFNSIKKVIEDPKYKEAVQHAGIMFRDQPNTPLQKAVWWTEYVIRNKGAPQLHSPAADLSWIEYLMLDIVLAAYFIVIFIYLLIKKVVFFLKSCFSINRPTNPKVKRKKN